MSKAANNEAEGTKFMILELTKTTLNSFPAEVDEEIFNVVTKVFLLVPKIATSIESVYPPENVLEFVTDVFDAYNAPNNVKTAFLCNILQFMDDVLCLKIWREKTQEVPMNMFVDIISLCTTKTELEERL